ncbi:NADH-quinone oxidoreductase subunit N [Arthrobacter cryoconiti]|uniref:NADH-quinone oxidoreductase subunit N n=1 Tax=Arthrobacter cryoconiti TaxID=748907 RepID=A0ABV8R478_9MICC|nr:proton-conducting transporter membrane subunit [Arthrobacter cryoconiti]MCC9069396.1 NADH-quinone oxidoreductase subunit N [Arthrobacter cryoconiti]
MSMNMDYLALLPEIVLLTAAVLVLLGGSFLPRTRQVITRWLTLAALAASATAGLAALARAPETIFDGSYTIDASTTVVRMAAPLATLVVILIGRHEFTGSARESETYALLLLATLGTVIIGGTTDLLVLVAGYLLASIPLYALIGLSRSGPAAEATLKTYLIGALFGVLLMAGVTLLTGLAATSNYLNMSKSLGNAPVAALAGGAVALLIGLTFKAGAVPGHFWIPDASQASGVAVAAFLTTVPKIGALVALGRLVEIMPDTVDVPLLIAMLAVISMTVGNLAALAQNNVRRLLGWSTVSQVGYLLMPLAVITASDGAWLALLAYIGLYALTNLTLFAVVACFPHREELDDWAGMARTHPWLTGTLIVGALSLVGTPPTAVFIGKVAVFTVAWDGGMPWLVVVAAANTVLSLLYYLRLIRPAFRTPGFSPQHGSRGTPGVALTVSGTAVTLGFLVLAAGAVGAGIWLVFLA